ncbi:hypothetical protein [Streptosporangium amethystogenes]|uniref:hypothetical protein n=1 Tax=Streptosporangium amethystogenes TaxID=2002 RepID=UPI0004C7A1E8|nr:hypothetical protein [Streptosporangium amethystogenes]
MEIGVYVGGAGLGLDEMTGQVRAAAEAGLDSAFLSRLTAWDALTVLALVGRGGPPHGSWRRSW